MNLTLSEEERKPSMDHQVQDSSPAYLWRGIAGTSLLHEGI